MSSAVPLAAVAEAASMSEHEMLALAARYPRSVPGIFSTPNGYFAYASEAKHWLHELYRDRQRNPLRPPSR